MRPCMNLAKQAIDTYVASRMYSEIEAMVSHRHFKVVRPEAADWLRFHRGWYEEQMNDGWSEWKLDPGILGEFIDYLTRIHYRISDSSNFEALCSAKIEVEPLFLFASLFEDDEVPKFQDGADSASGS